MQQNILTPFFNYIYWMQHYWATRLYTCRHSFVCNMFVGYVSQFCGISWHPHLFIPNIFKDSLGGLYVQDRASHQIQQKK